MTREEAKDLLQNIAAYDIDRQKGMAKQEALDMAIKALEQEPCEDAISRQAVIDLLYGEVKETYTISNGRITYRITDINFDDLMNIPSVTPQPCEDAISIDNVIEWLKNKDIIKLSTQEEIARKELRELPSVNSKKTGQWIPVSEKLPEENEYIGDVCKYYLIQDEYGDMHVAHLSNVGWIPMDSLKAIGDEVIAWMPLPPSYKGE